MNEINVYIGKKIRFYRKKKKISMKDMAIKLHVDCSTVSRYENGKRMINLHMLISILEMLDISFNDVFPHTTLEESMIIILLLNGKVIICYQVFLRMLV